MKKILLLVLIVTSDVVVRYTNLLTFDTQYSEGYSRKAFNEIMPGMSAYEVLKKIGQPLIRIPVVELTNDGPDQQIKEVWNYSQQGQNKSANYFQRRVLIDANNKVIRTEKEIYRD